MTELSPARLRKQRLAAAQAAGRPLPAPAPPTPPASRTLAAMHRDRAAARAFAAVEAAAAPAPASADNDNAPTSNEPQHRMLMQLAEDRRRLKSIQSVERKVELKRSLIPAYDAWVEGALAAERPAQDEIVVTMMLWRIDTGDLAGALPLARHVLAHGLTLPERFNRSVPCLIAEEAAEQALARLGAKEEVDIAALGEVEDLTEDEDMHDEVRAKLMKAIGLGLVAGLPALDEENRPALAGRALGYLRRAATLNPKAGVKKQIEALERALRPSADSSPPDA